MTWVVSRDIANVCTESDTGAENVTAAARSGSLPLIQAEEPVVTFLQ